MSELNHVVELVLGDWSGDGHKQSDKISIKSNLTDKEILKAYKAGSKKVGFDLINEVCSEYEDNRVSVEKVKALAEAGITNKMLCVDVNDEDDEDTTWSMWTDSYTELFLLIVKLGNKDFKYEYANSPSIDIGGYGLYF
jgi:hypothetical protein